MEIKSQIIRLIYKKCEKKMYFYPNNFQQLREYFLTIFDAKSSENYIFKAYPDKDKYSIIIFDEKHNFKEGLEQLIVLKNPTIFIYNENKENNLINIDDINIKYIIEKKIGFDYYNKKINYERIKKIVEKRKENLKKLEKRMNLLKEGINVLLNIPKIESINDLIIANQQIKEIRNEINIRLAESKEN